MHAWIESFVLVYNVKLGDYFLQSSLPWDFPTLSALTGNTYAGFSGQKVVSPLNFYILLSDYIHPWGEATREKKEEKKLQAFSPPASTLRDLFFWFSGQRGRFFSWCLYTHATVATVTVPTTSIELMTGTILRAGLSESKHPPLQTSGTPL